MSNPSRNYHINFEPVSPIDIVDNAQRRSKAVEFDRDSLEDEKKYATVTTRSRQSSSSSGASLKTPRTARFAEATSVHSPIDGRSPFADPPNMSESEKTAKVSDLGFGYINNEGSSMPVHQEATIRSNYDGSGGPMSPPLKSALKTPGTPGRHLNPLSPTFQEELALEKEEEKTDAQNQKDLKSKLRVRMAKMVLRGVNFSCSLIVLCMVSATFAIFNATKAIPPRSSLTPWAKGTNPWPQILLLVIACISLVFALFIFYAYLRGGHKRAEKAAVYYTMFAVFFFAFSIIMWAVGAAILQNSKAKGEGKDLWGWSCKDNKRRDLFKDDVQYDLVCRLQNWSLVCCIIEVVVEVITIAIYAVVFYRFWTKRRLRKSMDVRDKARNDLYLAQLRTQSAPNTPGFTQTPRSPYFPRHNNHDAFNDSSAAEEGNAKFGDISPASSHATQQPFQLQPPPIRVQNATPKPAQDGFEPAPSAGEDRVNDHVEAAPGEQQYAAVPIPGAYATPLTSPSFAPQQQYQQHPEQHYGSLNRAGSPGQAM